MKRLVYMMMALVVLFAANSCKDKKTAQVITPTVSSIWRKLPMIQPSTVFVVRVHLCTIWS